MSNTPVNIVLGLIGAGAVAQGLASVRDGLAGMGGEAARAAGDLTGLSRVLTTAGLAATAIAGVRAALNYGGALNDLSSRTGQTVRDLVIFQRALEAAGIGAANAAPTIALLQRAIAGLNEEGGKTGEAFARLGVVPAQLRSLGILQQIEALTRGFARIENPAERAALAMQLFSRSGTQMLQLLGDSGALAAAANDVGQLADRMQRNNAAFDAAGDRLSVMKDRFVDMAAAATENLLPALNTVANLIQNLRLGEIGAVAGSAIPTALGAAVVVKTVRGLDNLMLDWAKRQGAPIGQAFAARFLSPLASGLSRLLPIGLLLPIGKALIDGITAGLLESHRHADALAEEQHRKNLSRIKSLQEARTMAVFDEERERVKMELAAFEARRKAAAETPADVASAVTRAGGIAIPGAGAPPPLSAAEQNIEQLLRRRLEWLNSNRPKEIVGANLQKDADDQRLAAAKEIAAKLNEQAATYRKQADAAAYALAADQEKLDLLDRQLAKAQEQYFADLQAAEIATDDIARTAAREKLEAAALAIEKERNSVEASIAANAEKDAQAKKEAAEAAERAAEAARRQALEQARNALDERQLEIQRELMQLETDFRRTDADKWADRRTQLQAAVTAANDYLKAVQAIRDANPGDAQAQANFLSAQQGVLSAEGQLAGMGPNPHSFLEQMQAGLANLRAEWGTLQEQMAGGLTGAIRTGVDGVTNALTRWAMEGGKFVNFLGSVSNAIYGEIIGAIAAMVTRWVAGVVLMGVRWIGMKLGIFSAELSMAAAQTAALVPIAMAQSAIWITPATLATIASAGTAAAAAPGLIATSLAASKPLALFEKGGFTGGERGRLAGLVHGEEFVFSAPAVDAIGLDNLVAMHDAARSGTLSRAAPAALSQPSALNAQPSEPEPISIAIAPLDLASAFESYAESRRGRVFLANLQTGTVQRRK